MSKVHITFVSGEQAEYSPDQLSAMREQGQLPEGTQYWQEGMLDWQPIENYFAVEQALFDEDIFSAIIKEETGFSYKKDPRRLTKFLIGLLWADVGIGIISVLSSGAQLLDDSGTFDAILCLGCVIKGETDHDIYINNAVAQGLTQLSLSRKRPFLFGLLTPNTEQQALDRAGGKHGNKGVEVAVAAIKMAELARQLS